MKAPIVAVLLSLASSAPVVAGTFVYVSNAEDGDIGMYTLQVDGSLQPGQRFKATKLVMPMAVSPDKRFCTQHLDPSRIRCTCTRSMPVTARYAPSLFRRSPRAFPSYRST